MENIDTDTEFDYLIGAKITWVSTKLVKCSNKRRLDRIWIVTADGKDMVLGTECTFCDSFENDINGIAKLNDIARLAIYDGLIVTTDKIASLRNNQYEVQQCPPPFCNSKVCEPTIANKLRVLKDALMIRLRRHFYDGVITTTDRDGEK